MVCGREENPKKQLFNEKMIILVHPNNSLTISSILATR